MDTKYQKSKIYRVVNDDMPGLVYIGSTVNALSKRISQHRASTNRARSNVFQQCGKMEIYLIENFPCNTRDELIARERYHIENTDCINKQIPGRTKKEYNKIYNEEHKEQISEYHKIYREDNKEYINEVSKIYREKNKEIIAQKQKEMCECECGRSYTRHHKARHEKSKHHLNYIHIKETLASN